MDARVTQTPHKNSDSAFGILNMVLLDYNIKFRKCQVVPNSQLEAQLKDVALPEEDFDDDDFGEDNSKPTRDMVQSNIQKLACSSVNLINKALESK